MEGAISLCQACHQEHLTLSHMRAILQAGPITWCSMEVNNKTHHNKSVDWKHHGMYYKLFCILQALENGKPWPVFSQMGLLALDSLSIPTHVWQETQQEIVSRQREMAGDQKIKVSLISINMNCVYFGLMWDWRNKPRKSKAYFFFLMEKIEKTVSFFFFNKPS